MGKNVATVRTEVQDVASLFSRPSASSASSDKVSLLYIPGFDSDDRFADQYCRLLWYVHPILPHVSEIRMATDGVPPSCCDIPDYLDPKIAALAERFEGKVVRFDNNDPQAWQEAIDRADVLLHWDLKSFHHDRRIAHLQKNAVKQIKRYRVDPIHEQYEGSMYLKLSHDLNPEFQKDLAASHTRFMHMLGELGTCRKGYIFGTGPSLSKAMEMDFSDGLTIACNSMARNRALLTRLDHWLRWKRTDRPFVLEQSWGALKV